MALPRTMTDPTMFYDEAPPQMAPPEVQHPMHAMIAPIYPKPEPDPMIAYESGLMKQGAGATSQTKGTQVGGENQPGKAVRMAPSDPYEDALRTKQMADLEKDQNPYGSEGNHPGFFGKLLHGLSVATGGPNRRQFAEQERQGQIQGIEKEKSAQALQGAQTDLAGATAAHTAAETPEVAPNAESNRAYQGAETQKIQNDIAQGPSLATAYAHRVNQVLKENGDPSTDPIVMHLQDAITSLQKEAAPKSLMQSQPVIGPDGKPHTYLLDPATGKKVEDEGVHYERPMNVNVNAAGERADRNEVLKAYAPTQQSAERMNVMTDAYEKAIKDHDQQAMLNLLANHLGMTMGLQKGARMTKDIIKEAQKSQPFLQGVAAKFDKDGYLSGVTLSPNQMRQMVNLGQQRYIEDAKTSRATARYIGAKDDGPERVPGPATMRYYLAQTGGDVNKAKQMAAGDGWSVGNAR